MESFVLDAGVHSLVVSASPGSFIKLQFFIVLFMGSLKANSFNMDVVDPPTPVPSRAPAPPAHILLDLRLENVKVQAKVTTGDYENKNLVVWGTILQGTWRIVHAVRGLVKDLTSAKVVLNVLNPMHTDSHLVVINGEHIFVGLLFQMKTLWTL
ncbi:hypothetical protein H0H81_006018 [Sphagnurus paluster]|uniref:Uncharacterized protein n=1 Tax=Sphagnurus paluster TaxID=117069 RepID=A0A9P7K214_9AGAR|nr:hypothetical protein H0H81_006018 [Sphagnurus paluster]